ncbi:hypothetical protein ABI_21910 [Asticcacaulis biprosthecium C19]|uniref:Uncharacterized protein n=1 Tax=Asticcacaulis biprosthecium C19 TaxID=715226 RepID=F4QGZ6_9CAUL|nr:hypothetical protein [Asticcacaulis biprosthecium]EGF93749.1 hypothetical protein ABI_21910 [Asticcacaulis biprosthecium C19]
MSFDLPALPRESDIDFLEIRAGGDLEGPLNGATIRINRLGDKTGVRVSLPTLKRGGAGDAWVAALLRGKLEPARLALPLPDGGVGDPGTPLVDGDGQAGAVLNLKGLTPGYVVGAGQAFSVIQDSVRYLHFATAAATADGSGDVSVSLAPMLRMSPADGAVVELAGPKIEGWIRKDEAGWSQAWTGIVTTGFTLIEAR